MYSSNIVTISVLNLEIVKAKGLYDEELLVENRFLLSAIVKVAEEKMADGNFINYETIAEILKNEMETTERLLEAIAKNILIKINETWPFLNSSKISIQKINPAFDGCRVGAVVVEIER